jgi:sulfur relay (sulfurtransferase) complex TusBCD TusD component (DsrE family)
MNIGIIIYSEDAETVWNAFRFGNFALKKGDNTKVFLMGKGVDCESLTTDKFNVTEQIRSFIDSGGKTFACGSCLKIRHSEGSEACPLSTMEDLYRIVKESDKIVTF